jgi:hypothetical protein
MVHVLGRDARRAAGPARSSAGCTKVFSSFRCSSHREQAADLVERGGHLGGGGGVGGAHLRERAGHEQAQGLVDAGIQVDAAGTGVAGVSGVGRVSVAFSVGVSMVIVLVGGDALDRVVRASWCHCRKPRPTPLLRVPCSKLQETFTPPTGGAQPGLSAPA